MKITVGIGTLALSIAILLSSNCEFGVAQNSISSIRMLGSNSPTGESYDDLISLDGGAQLIANDSLSVTPGVFELGDNEYYFEVRYSSASGPYVADTDASWFANFRLTFDAPTANSQTYFWFEDGNGPVDLAFDGWGGDIIEHPFESGFEVASFNSSRDDGLEHQFGIFSNPFASIPGELGVDPSTVTGYGLGVRLITAVPEPSSGILIFAAITITSCRRRHSIC